MNAEERGFAQIRTGDSSPYESVAEKTLKHQLDELLPQVLQTDSLEEYGNRNILAQNVCADKYDHITRHELQRLLRTSCLEGQLTVDGLALETLVAAFFAKAGRPNEAAITLKEFIAVLKNNSDNSLSTVFEDNEQPACKASSASERISIMNTVRAKASHVVRVENVQLAVWQVLIVLSQLAGFIVGILKNDEGPYFDLYGWSYPIGKGAAQAIQITLIIFPFTSARSLLTYLRGTALYHLFPLNDNLKLHNLLGYQFFFWSCVHTIANIINGAHSAKPEKRQPNSTREPRTASQTQFYAREVSITGVVLMGVLIVGYVFALPWPKDSWLTTKSKISRWPKTYEAFYLSHVLMAVAVLILLIIHPMPGKPLRSKTDGSTTWAYVLTGAAIYILERIARIFRQATWKTTVMGVTLHQGVIEVRLEKPSSAFGLLTIHGKAGQYCDLNIPELARFEWHPFSLTSGPNDDHISFHIHSAGDWTRALYQRCEDTLVRKKDVELAPATESSDIGSHRMQDCYTLSKELKVRIDGPFGAPAQDHSRFTCLLLVGAGVGISPFASVLRQLLDEYSKSNSGCIPKSKESPFKVQKVYFTWMTREQSAPRYFQRTLEDIKDLDRNNFLEVNIYLTQAVPQHNLLGVIAKVAQTIQHEESGLDAYTGTHQPAPCFFGRPDWPSTFSRISKENPGSKIGVFVCGPDTLCNTLQRTCKAFNASNYHHPAPAEQGKTRFIFHKENF